MDPDDLSHHPPGAPGDPVPNATAPPDGGPAGPVLPAAPGTALLMSGPGGPIGPASVDSDADGVADTVLLPAAPGPPVPGAPVLGLVTDLDHDGDGDVLTSLYADGAAHTVALPDPRPAAAAPDPFDGFDGFDGFDDDAWAPDRDGHGGGTTDGVWEGSPSGVGGPPGAAARWA